MLSMNAMGQNTAYTISKDEKNGEQVFNGALTFKDLDSEPSFTWMKSGREAYKPDEKEIGVLDSKLNAPGNSYTMIIFLGTWCDDSHDLVPKLEKVLQTLKFPVDKITMYGTDRNKATKNGENKLYDITNVPTIILLNKGKETGRITESVKKSIEADLAALLR